jgi:hypothetical protein
MKKKRRLSVTQDETNLQVRVQDLEVELERRDGVERELKLEVKRLQMETETLMKIVANLTQKYV